MQKVKEGDQVKVHYTGKLTTGDTFDSSVGREPLAFTVGAGQMIKGFDAAMPGMAIGEKKTINILPGFQVETGSTASAQGTWLHHLVRDHRAG